MELWNCGTIFLLLLLQKKISETRWFFRKEYYFPSSINVGNDRKISLGTGSVPAQDPGSGAFLTLDPGSGIGFSGSRIPDPKPISIGDG